MFPYWIFNFLVILSLYNLVATCISVRILSPPDDMAPTDQNDTGLPYKDHPLYKLRAKSVITSIIGFVLNFIAIIALIDSGTYQIPPFLFSLIFLFISFIFVLHDLITYAAAKAAALVSRSDLPTVTLPTTNHALTTPGRDNELTIPIRRAEDKPQWPTRRLLVIDFILAFVFQFLFWVEFGTIVGTSHYYYSGGSETFESYSNLTNLAASILHGVAFWKELMARKKRSWQRSLDATPCSNCGHLNNPASDPNAPATTANVPCEHTDIERGQSSTSLLESFEQVKATLPKWAKASMGGERDIENDAEAPLLITPDESTTEVGGPSSGYGTLDQSVGSIPETIVKKKGKGKKRMVEVDSE
jgi:hypothetical protein